MYYLFLKFGESILNFWNFRFGFPQFNIFTLFYCLFAFKWLKKSLFHWRFYSVISVRGSDINWSLNLILLINISFTRSRLLFLMDINLIPNHWLFAIIILYRKSLQIRPETSRFKIWGQIFFLSGKKSGIKIRSYT